MVQKIQPDKLKNINGFRFFYQYSGKSIFLVVIFSLFVGLLDGIGLSLFLPLLQTFDDSQAYNSDNLGNIKILTDTIQNIGISLTLTNVLLIISFFFIIKGVFVLLESYYTNYVQQNFAKNLRVEGLMNLKNLQYNHFIKSDVGQIQNTLTGEAIRATSAFGSYFLTLQQLIIVIVYISFAFFIDYKFAFLVCLGGGISNLLLRTLNKLTKHASVDVSSNSNRLQSLIIQSVHTFKYLKATGFIQTYFQFVNEKINHLKKLGIKIGLYSAILKGIREPIIMVIITIVILVQVNLFDSPIGPILISLLFFYRALTSIMGAQASWNYYLGNYGAIENYSKHINTNKNHQEVESNSKIDFNQFIEINNLYFKVDDKTILSNINLRINKYDTLAIVGESGSGKTTLVNILSGLIPKSSGIINIDGIQTENLVNKEYKRKIGYITQEPVIFNDTLFNNVTLWSEKTSDNLANFHKVLKQAYLTDYFMAIGSELDYGIESNGANLSGGQRQRISIARELYKNPEILILDEATSALDAESEMYIRNCINEIKGRYTILIIAHRLSTVKEADKIVLMQAGTIIDSGNYSELIQKNNKFKEMVSLQTL